MQLLGTLGGIGTIAVGVILFTSERSAEQRVEADRARQEVMQSYLGDMKELVLDKGLLLSELGSPERQFARTNTLTALRQLDGSQKGLLLQFLHGANLITVSVSGSDPIVSLFDADLSKAFLRGADLRGADLSKAFLLKADLRGATLSGAFLTGADLRGALLIDADLSDANLRGADLTKAFLLKADLRRADLSKAFLNKADLSGANLIAADLYKADLIEADLSRASLRGANLRGALLIDADLSDANLRGANLRGAFWENTTCPDGTNSDANGDTCVGHFFF